MKLNINLINDFRDSFCSFLDKKEIENIKDNGEVKFEILDLNNLYTGICGLLDFKPLEFENVVIAIGYFRIPKDIHPLKMYLTVNHINSYAANFNVSVSEKDGGAILICKYTAVIDYKIENNNWNVLFNSLRYISLSLFNLIHHYLKFYELFNSVDIKDFCSLHYREFIINKLGLFEKNNRDALNKGVNYKEDLNLKDYELSLKDKDKKFLEHELDIQLELYKKNKDNSKLLIIQKYLK